MFASRLQDIESWLSCKRLQDPTCSLSGADMEDVVVEELEQGKLEVLGVRDMSLSMVPQGI